MRPAVFLLFVAGLLAADAPPPPHLDRVVPLGGMRGVTVTVDLVGEYLANAVSVWFDCADLRWVETIEASSGLLRGRVSIAPEAAPGPHILNVRSKDGRSNTRLFNVTQFPAVLESEIGRASCRERVYVLV